MREKIRKLIIERISDFFVNNENDFNFLDYDINDVTPEKALKRKGPRVVPLWGFTFIVADSRGKYFYLFACFDGLIKVKEYIKNRKKSEIFVGDFSFMWVVNPNDPNKKEILKQQLFSKFKDAEEITIYDYTDPAISDYKKSKYISQQTREREGGMDVLTVYENFNDDLLARSTYVHKITKTEHTRRTIK